MPDFIVDFITTRRSFREFRTTERFLHPTSSPLQQFKELRVIGDRIYVEVDLEEFLTDLQQ